MTVAQLVGELGLEVLTGNTNMDREVKSRLHIGSSLRCYSRHR